MGKSRILQINGAILTSKELESELEREGAEYNIIPKSDVSTYPIPRLIDNYMAIKETYSLLNEHVNLGISIHPAGEWILDNFYIIEETVKQIKQELTKKKYKNFVALNGGEFSGFARSYVLASQIVNFSDNKIEIENLEKYLSAYQTKKALNMDEIWNIGLFLQIALLENIRKICEKIYMSQIEKYKVESIIERLIENKEEKRFVGIKVLRKPKQFSNLRYPFVEYMSYKLKKYGRKTAKHLEILEEEIEKTGTTVSDMIKKEHFDIAIQKVSIGNAITSIKAIQRINFLEIFEKINEVEEILKLDPAGVYDKMDYKTKDYYRQIIKEISYKTKISELYIAKKLIEICEKGRGKKSHIGYFIFGKNKNVLLKKIGIKPKKIMSQMQKAKYYITIIYTLSLIFSILAITNYIGKIPGVLNILGVIILIIPMSEVVVQIIQFVLVKIVKPKPIPKIDFSNGIDENNSTMVVIPTILKSKEKVRELVRKLEVFYLANKSENIYFCLLGDAAESTKKVEEFDKEVAEEGIKQVKILNKKYNNPNLFFFLYRRRKWNEKQESYLGWERKRGALAEFVQLLKGKIPIEDYERSFWVSKKAHEKGELPEFPKVKYIITLDSDTDLILNSAAELVGAMAHILNKPEIVGGKVISGYGLIQPRVGVNIDVSNKNMFTKIFAGSGGIDSYTNAISDVYQDNFGEGIFAGKGIFDIDVYSKILSGEIPENIVLSHDLLEGSYLRCGLASDILLMDGYPGKYMSFMTRLARWIRGDWQIISWIKSKKLNVLSKYKIFDNLRRSLFEIFVAINLMYFYILGNFFNVNMIGLETFLGISVITPFLLEIVNMIIQKKEGEQKQDTFVPKISGFIGAIYRLFLTFASFPYKAYISFKSICTSIYRMKVSKRKLLEWTTSEEAEKNSKDDLFSYYKSMYINWLVGAILVIISVYNKNIFDLIIGAIWISAPWIMHDISIERVQKKKKLNSSQEEYIKEIAERTFKYFKDNINKENNYLVPDNYQEDRKEKYVDRTSSTNIGLSILSIIAGIELKFLPLEEGINIIFKIIETIDSLEKWNGHLYNWYNIKTKTPLVPRYISTVDSGNFVGYLYVLKSFLNKLIQDDEFSKQQDKEELVKNMYETVNRLIDNTDFSHLYSNSHRLFSIGFNVEDRKINRFIL